MGTPNQPPCSAQFSDVYEAVDRFMAQQPDWMLRAGWREFRERVTELERDVVDLREQIDDAQDEVDIAVETERDLRAENARLEQLLALCETPSVDEDTDVA